MPPVAVKNDGMRIAAMALQCVWADDKGRKCPVNVHEVDQGDRVAVL